ncbi:hypothetical protein JD844_025893 [Phrynosoma platyrhinos]|uniref:Uncharacterized protein n=1 Tax=Phrynosoma platyrhinos TaxID=52577 RepID=A0ABQ7SZQ1_PHRPL|nr:hypothetical protein JD844_025893 [Phrynosoma platyrhinos]
MISFSQSVMLSDRISNAPFVSLNYFYSPFVSVAEYNLEFGKLALSEKDFEVKKSPAKKLSHAISKSLGCVPTREPPHPVYPEEPEKPLDLAHIV